MKKERADKVLANRGLADSYQKAQALIMAGLVFSGKQRIEKPGQMIASDRELTLKEKNPYVSRGGLKLAEALEVFEIPIQNKVAADLGASTGGFTDCLLRKGAKRVYAVDVDISQLDWHLKEDSRVVCIEKNARYLTKDDFAPAPDIVTTDLSFISVLKVLPAVKEFLGNGQLLSLIKPQFEARKEQVGKKRSSDQNRNRSSQDGIRDERRDPVPCPGSKREPRVFHLLVSDSRALKPETGSKINQGGGVE
jgi:23S rRNA (cytidine1920-2'-O)/16S rRNA (cytidine1409-2'-O)-methyltransferase